MSEDDVVPGGIYLERIIGKVGTGSTAKDSVTENFWKANPLQNGTVKVELLDLNDQPSGYTEEVELVDFHARFTHQPDFKPRQKSGKLAQAERLASRGERHLADEEYLSAEYEFNSAIKIDEDNVRANFGLGKTYLALGEDEKAKDIFRKLSEVEEVLEPRHKHIFNEFGIKLRQLGMFSEAVKHYNRALTLVKDDENLWYNLGRALCEGGQVEKGLLALKNCLKLNPSMDVASALIKRYTPKDKPE